MFFQRSACGWKKMAFESCGSAIPAVCKNYLMFEQSVRLWKHSICIAAVVYSCSERPIRWLLSNLIGWSETGVCQHLGFTGWSSTLRHVYRWQKCHALCLTTKSFQNSVSGCTQGFSCKYDQQLYPRETSECSNGACWKLMRQQISSWGYCRRTEIDLLASLTAPTKENRKQKIYQEFRA